MALCVSRSGTSHSGLRKSLSQGHVEPGHGSNCEEDVGNLKGRSGDGVEWGPFCLPSVGV